MAVLAGLASLGWVVPFAEDTPARLIGAVLPDVLVKGGDYRPEQVAGYAAEAGACAGRRRCLRGQDWPADGGLPDRGFGMNMTGA